MPTRPSPVAGSHARRLHSTSKVRCSTAANTARRIASTGVCMPAVTPCHSHQPPRLLPRRPLASVRVVPLAARCRRTHPPPRIKGLERPALHVSHWHGSLRSRLSRLSHGPSECCVGTRPAASFCVVAEFWTSSSPPKPTAPLDLCFGHLSVHDLVVPTRTWPASPSEISQISPFSFVFCSGAPPRPAK